MAWRGMASVNQTRPHCVNQMGKAHTKPLAARHGRGTAWARHVMGESAFTLATCSDCNGRHKEMTRWAYITHVNLKSPTNR